MHVNNEFLLFSAAGREDVHHRERQPPPGQQTGCDHSLERTGGPQEPLPTVQVLKHRCLAG